MHEKSFPIFTNPEYMPEQKLKDGAKNWILNNVVKTNKDIKRISANFKNIKDVKSTSTRRDG